MARTNPFRFSTKYQDDETDQLYYGHRYYDASTGRWMSRDPIGELSSPALYALVSNDSLIHWDYLGLEVGTVRVIRNEPLVSVIGFGWQLELEWVPPVEWNDIRNNCIPCRRAVWVQDYKYDIDLIWPWTDTHTDWVRDWDENDYSGSAYEWIAGARSSKTSWMHDEPVVGPRYRVSDVKFEAVARLKCTEGLERGATYATVRWWYFAPVYFPLPGGVPIGLTVGGIESIE